MLKHQEKAGWRVKCSVPLSTLLAGGCLHLHGRALQRQAEQTEHNPSCMHGEVEAPSKKEVCGKPV